MEDKVYDVLGVGIGPFNLGLAALAQPLQNLKTLFVDQAAEFNWHPGLMLSDATLQVPFMADLVTMADPTSKFSFLNYLKQTDRIYKFYIREDFFVLRKEYNAYCRWVLNQLNNCQFNLRVTDCKQINGIYEVSLLDLKSNSTNIVFAKKLVFGTGTSPKIPDFASPAKFGKVLHSSEYLNFKTDILKQQTVTIVGSGQSAAEIFYDLLPETENGLQLNWFTRPDRFFPMEYSKLTLELTSPEYVDHFYGLSEQKRQQILKRQNPLFKGINFDLINQIFDKLYELSVDGKNPKAYLSPNCQLNGVQGDTDGNYQLTFEHTETEKAFQITTDYLIMATGYGYREPDFLATLNKEINRTADGQFAVNRNYSIDNNNSLFVQNAELHTHGFVTADLGMGAYRNATIINAISQKEVYKVEKRIAFQQFTQPESAPVTEESLILENTFN